MSVTRGQCDCAMPAVLPSQPAVPRKVTKHCTALTSCFFLRGVMSIVPIFVYSKTSSTLLTHTVNLYRWPYLTSTVCVCVCVCQRSATWRYTVNTSETCSILRTGPTCECVNIRCLVRTSKTCPSLSSLRTPISTTSLTTETKPGRPTTH